MTTAIKSILCIFLILTLIPGNALSLTIAEEEELGREFMKVVSRNFKFIKDPIILNHVRGVGKKILETVPPQPFPYRFYIIQSHVYNAFAGPGGNIFINSGLLEAMENEDELAGILAHEVSHSVCRHISQRIERSKKIGLATLAGIAAGIFLGAGGGGAIANAVSLGSIAAAESVALAYSRDDEMQADQLGYNYLKQAGYSGQGILTMLRKIRSKQWFGTEQIPSYMMTHPAMEDRMAYIGATLERDAEAGKSSPPAPSSEFDRMHVRLVALYGNKDFALEYFKDRIRNEPENTMNHYGYALILARIGNRNDAIAHLKIALEKHALDTDMLAELGRIYFMDGKYSESYRALIGALAISPENPDGQFYLGRTQLEQGQYTDAILRFEKLMDTYPEYDDAFYFLGEAYGKDGQLSDAHYWLGKYYYSQGDLKNAAFHLKRSQKEIQNPEKQEAIAEMLKDIKKEESMRDSAESK